MALYQLIAKRETWYHIKTHPAAQPIALLRETVSRNDVTTFVVFAPKGQHTLWFGHNRNEALDWIERNLV